MRNYVFILTLLAFVSCAWAQKHEWSSPFVGYSTTKVLTLDKVEFEKGKTLLHVTATAASGTSISVSPDAYLSANGKHYAIQKATVLGLGKQYTMPDSGKVHFTMQFPPLPVETRLFHFTEGVVETGWTLCNIRERQEDLVTEVPEEWKNITYPEREELPDSYFSDDSTCIHVKILNYVPEVGTKLEVFTLYDVDDRYYSREYDIFLDGTATIKQHPCVPQTIYFRLGKGPYSFFLIQPGKDISVLMDLGKGGTEPFVAFKGELSRANYEINVKGAKNLYWFDNSDAHFESLLLSGKSLYDEYGALRNKYSTDPILRQFAMSTRDWLYLYAERQTVKYFKSFNSYVNRKLKDDLKSANSLLLKNNFVKNSIRSDVNAVKETPTISASSKMTYCLDFMYYSDGKYKNNKGDVNTFNKDISLLHEALVSIRNGDKEQGGRAASLIQDSTIRAYYPIAAKRWNDYVVQLNSIPHIHFDQHGDVKKDELKNKVLDDYKGKSVVFLVYDRKKHGKDLDELEKEFITKADEQKVVFIHIDTRSPAMDGTGAWADAAVKRKGEHYAGKKNRYDSMFSGHSPFFDGQFYYELYAPDGTCTLQTTDKKKAFAAIGKLVKQ
ncbi:MAG: hypothetical protein SPK34_01270 [Bacteroidaceae bacterium]|nr:hypothetical protein [Prevotellaceae bacterium]MDY5759572.1 hypothetical protein [Bacteroidaceae bacterium]